MARRPCACHRMSVMGCTYTYTYTYTHPRGGRGSGGGASPGASLQHIWPIILWEYGGCQFWCTGLLLCTLQSMRICATPGALLLRLTCALARFRWQRP
jgi:hypothetical protein